jgi:DNA-binding transcriptional MerR regulator
MNGPKIRRLYYSASEIAETVHVPPQVLKHWESVFHDLKSVSRGGRRLFSPSDFERVVAIKRLVDQGIPLERVRDILAQTERPAPGDRPSVPAGAVPDRRPAQAMPIISKVLRELEEILQLLQSVVL